MRAIGEERQQQLAAGKSGNAADRAGKRVARDAQVALRQAERARGEIVLGDREEGAADQRAAIEEFEPREYATAQATTGSQNFSIPDARCPDPISRGNGCGSVLHLIAVTCWIISASASVDST